tara:strand:+ start:45 stop:905 length:861 start_codon:yes stop_codon:yes gene_type:complete
MFLIIGGGEVSNYLNIYAARKSLEIINLSRKVNLYGRSIIYREIGEVANMDLDKRISHCVISWSFTNLKSSKDIRRSVVGFSSISELIKRNSKVKFLFLSSSSASSGLLGNSNYGTSKRLGEQILLDNNLIRDSNYPIRVIRSGLIYGLNNCPISLITMLYKYRIKLVLGRSNSLFAVTDAEDLAKFIFDISSPLWESESRLNGFYEKEKFSIDFIHETCKEILAKRTFSLSLTNKSIAYQLIKTLGSKIDLSLASFDRYPSIPRIKYHPTNSFQKYLRSLCSASN